MQGIHELTVLLIHYSYFIVEGKSATGGGTVENRPLWETHVESCFQDKKRGVCILSHKNGEFSIREGKQRKQFSLKNTSDKKEDS